MASVSTVLAILIFTISCSSGPYLAAEQQLPIRSESDTTRKVAYSIYLIGDAGAPAVEGSEETLESFASRLQQSGPNSSAVFLGDNIYEYGMPADTTGRRRAIAEKKIVQSLETLENFEGKAYFIPGNHDWYSGKRGLLAQDEFVDQYNGADTRFILSDGCPGPVTIRPHEEWLLLFLDSEWWINRSSSARNRPAGCRHQSTEQVISSVVEIVTRHSERNILIASHHPLYSNGTHGGYFPPKDHLFPLTNIKPWLYVPLPVVGSVYPVYRKLGRSGQDLRNERYREYRESLLEAVDNAEHVFFASGHEHNLSLFERDDHYQIVSGSGSKTSYARHGNGAEFVYSEHGYARLLSYTDRAVEIRFWAVTPEAPEGELVFRKLLKHAEPDMAAARGAATGEDRRLPGKTVTAAAGPMYEAGPLKRAVWGDHYRDAWTTPVEVPVIDLETERGGLEVLKRGGGQQSVSIVVKDTAGQKYMMRSIQKDPSKALPEVLRETVAKSIVQDQISASHPYGALVIPPLAEAAGVYHTNPELGFVPEGAGLHFPGETAGAIVLFEEFVNARWFNRTFQANATEVVDTEQVWQQLRASSRNRIDEEQLLRSRLFDMFVGDWDRHDGQWLWTATENGEGRGTRFEPIPIDRDNVFFKSDGLVPGTANRKWALRKFQHFDEDIRDIAGINLNAKDFDRWFLTGLSLEDWLTVAEELSQHLTDRVIEKAVRRWPDPVYELDGDAVTRKLKVRRDRITDFARRYYRVLSEEVNVYGTNGSERFLVNRTPSGVTTVTVTARETDQKGYQPVYRRSFHPDVTREIRLFGFDGEDRFTVEGEAGRDQAIKVRIIGGFGGDEVTDHSIVPGGDDMTIVYDTKQGTRVEKGDATELNLRSNPQVNRFQKESFHYDYTRPLLTGGYNQDDGLFLGGGVRFVRHGFRKEPYAALHEIKGKHSTLTSAYSVDYASEFTKAVAGYDLAIDLNIWAPNYKSNYFGLGNGTKKGNDSDDFYGFRYDQVVFSAALQKRISSITRFRFGGGYEYYEASATPDRFVTSPRAGLDASDFNARHYTALRSVFDISTTDNDVMPSYGIKVNTEAVINFGLTGNSETFGEVRSEASLYYTFERLSTTLALRAGAATNIGKFEFFQANTLGGQTLMGSSGNLRGYLRDRFAGRTTFYHNTELRTTLFHFQSYLFPGSVGILGFVDNGRVWQIEDSSRNWHQGYGGGIWISPFRRAVLSATYDLSPENRLFSVNVGFLF
ncbi:MAG: BamA/TamA family outer membrane protein [Balneolaceae bacterium]|nr:BamA/TamA family outer membrane protein [Balneolaceae bacterium]